MRKQLVIGVLALPFLAFAQATKVSSETKVETTTTTPSSKTQVTTDKTVKQKSDGSTSTVVEKTATHNAPPAPAQSSHSKQTVERSPSGAVTKSETVQEKK